MNVIATQDGLPVTPTNRFPIELYGPGGTPIFQEVRANLDATLLASAARTATTATATLTNHGNQGIMVWLNITAASGTGGLTLQIFGVNPVTGTRTTLLQGSLITTTGHFGYDLKPGASTAGIGGAGNIGLRVAGSLPRSYVVQVAHNDGSSYSYSVAASLLI